MAFNCVCSELLRRLLELLLCSLRISARCNSTVLILPNYTCLVFNLYVDWLILSVHFRTWSRSCSILAMWLLATGSIVTNTPIHSIIHHSCLIHSLSLPTKWILTTSCVINRCALTLIIWYDATSNDTKCGWILALSLLLDHWVILLHLINVLLCFYRTLEHRITRVDIACGILFHLGLGVVSWNICIVRKTWTKLRLVTTSWLRVLVLARFVLLLLRIHNFNAFVLLSIASRVLGRLLTL